MNYAPATFLKHLQSHNRRGLPHENPDRVWFGQSQERKPGLAIHWIWNWLSREIIYKQCDF
jgi:hypothetical protein